MKILTKRGGGASIQPGMPIEYPDVSTMMASPPPPYGARVKVMDTGMVYFSNGIGGYIPAPILDYLMPPSQVAYGALYQSQDYPEGNTGTLEVGMPIVS